MALKLGYDAVAPGSGPTTQSKTVEDVKATVVANIDAMVAAIEAKLDPPTSNKYWMTRHNGGLKVSVRYGVKPLYFNEGMDKNSTMLAVPDGATAIKVYRAVKKATLDGELDKEYAELLERSKRGAQKKKKKGK